VHRAHQFQLFLKKSLLENDAQVCGNARRSFSAGSTIAAQIAEYILNVGRCFG